MKLIVSALARQDQDDISRYTQKQWGRGQLLTYINGLLDTLDGIADGRIAGKTVTGIPPRFLRVTYRSHFIFYSQRGDAVRIVRILHQRMDHARHLN